VKGQASSVFRIMIGATFAVALLIIIYSATSGIRYPYSGLDSCRDVVLEAQKGPGKCFAREKVSFSKEEQVMRQDFGADVVFRSTAFFSCPTSSGCVSKQTATAQISAKCTSTTQCTLYLGDGDCSI